MKMRIRLALVGCLLSVGAHLYLALHYYPLKVGAAGAQSLCSLNAKFDCDAVSASAYSAFLGVPLAIWGAVANAVLFVLILMSWLEWSEHPERLRRWCLALAGMSVAASVVMGAISLLFMHNYCLFCIALYIISIGIFVAYMGIPREPFWANLRHDLPHLWQESRGVALSLLSIPVLGFLLHQIFMQNLGIAEIGRMVKESIQEWEAAPKFDFVAKPTLAMGATQDAAAMTLVEFADFRCGHCKRASFSLHAFVKSHPDVRLEFYSYPLDGACNDKIETSSGISCRLAATVYCAEKEGKGWEAHDSLFGAQDEINQLSTVTELDVVLSKQIPAMGLSWERLQTCLNDVATIDAIKAQAKQGSLVNVLGTPTLFANGKLINRVLVPVLQEAREKLLLKR
jgi:protein-disulfide isomerase/uncharacterized membrane protein